MLDLPCNSFAYSGYFAMLLFATAPFSKNVHNYHGLVWFIFNLRKNRKGLVSSKGFTFNTLHHLVVLCICCHTKHTWAVMALPVPMQSGTSWPHGYNRVTTPPSFTAGTVCRQPQILPIATCLTWLVLDLGARSRVLCLHSFISCCRQLQEEAFTAPQCQKGWLLQSWQKRVVSCQQRWPLRYHSGHYKDEDEGEGWWLLHEGEEARLLSIHITNWTITLIGKIN